MQNIAKAVYGDSRLWWRIADANGLSAASSLSTGQSLTIPPLTGGTYNSAGSFRPYDAASIIGDTSPTMPPPPAGGGGGGCGGLGAIIMVVVAVVVAVQTGQYLAAPETAAGTGGAGWSSTAAAGAAGGAAGAVASQAVGNAIGAVDGFNWKQVALAALGGGVTAGLGNADLLNNKLPTSTANIVARAAVANAMSQGIGVITGLQKSFNWAGVAAAGVGAGVGNAKSDALLGQQVQDANGNWSRPNAGTAYASAWNPGGGGSNPLDGTGKLLAGILSGMAAGTAAAAMRGGKFSVQQVATDAFGNALGNSIVDNARNSGSGSQQTAEVGRAYALAAGASGEGLRLGGGAGLSFGGLQAAGVEDAQLPMEGVLAGPPMRNTASVGVLMGSKGMNSLSQVFMSVHGRSPSPYEAIALTNYNRLADAHSVRSGLTLQVPEALAVLDDYAGTAAQMRAYQSRATGFDIARIQGLTRYSQADRFNDPNFLLVAASEARIGAFPYQSLQAAERAPRVPPSGLEIAALSAGDGAPLMLIGDPTVPTHVVAGYSGPSKMIGDTAARFITQDNEVKFGGALYAGIGGNAEVSLKFNFVKTSLEIKEFEAGMGWGAGWKVLGGWKQEGTLSDPLKEATSSNVLYEKKFFGEQRDGTVAIGLKFSAEGQIGPAVAGVDGRAGLQSTVGGGETGGFTSVQVIAKRASPWGVGAQVKADVFNWSYKK